MQHTDDASIRAFNEIENQLTEKKFGLVFEEHTEEVDEMLKENIPVCRHSICLKRHTAEKWTVFILIVRTILEQKIGNTIMIMSFERMFIGIVCGFL